MKSSKRSRMLGACTLGIAAVALAGCSAKWNTAFRDRAIPQDSPSVITVDAKQRHVLIQPDFAPDTAKPQDSRFVKLRLCAEPAPDVFAVIATSGSGSLKVDGKSQSGEGAFGLSAAETAATIERTQTINLLRESFFRTCERYLNGAISKESFIVQAGRDARAMVAILAIEQLTGAVKAPATIISGPAVTANARLSSELVSLYKEADKERAEAKVAFEPLEAKLDADCEKPADKKDECEAEKKKATKAKAKLDAAQARIDEIVKLSDNVGQGTSALASTMAGTNQPGGVTNPPSKSDIAVVAGTVHAIVKTVTDVDDMKLYCIQSLTELSKKPDEPLYASCLTLLVAATKSEATALDAKALYESAKLQLSLQELAELKKFEAENAARQAQFDMSWDKLGVDCTKKLAPILGSADLPKVCDSDRAKAVAAFGKVGKVQQEKILALLEKGA